MKLLLALTVTLAVFSCEKEWNCIITTKSESDVYNNTSTKDYVFSGTREEMEAFEEEGTSTFQTGDITITQTTECN